MASFTDELLAQRDQLRVTQDHVTELGGFLSDFGRLQVEMAQRLEELEAQVASMDQVLRVVTLMVVTAEAARRGLDLEALLKEDLDVEVVVSTDEVMSA